LAAEHAARSVDLFDRELNAFLVGLEEGWKDLVAVELAELDRRLCAGRRGQRQRDERRSAGQKTITGQHVIPSVKQTFSQTEPSEPGLRTTSCSVRVRRARLYSPMTVLPRDDVDRPEAADQRAIRLPTAERDLQMHLVRPDMDRRALVPLAARPAAAGARHEISG